MSNSEAHWRRAASIGLLVCAGCGGESHEADAAVDGPSGVDAGAPCTVEGGCAGMGLVCDTGTNGCVECVSADSCRVGEVCILRRCEPPTPCETSRTCPGLVCDLELGVCAECASMVDCPDGLDCVEGVCRMPSATCGSMTDCTALGLICDTDAGECVECLTTANCSPGTRCSTDRVCVAVCMNDAECSDGVFCNGVERCDPRDGRGGARGCLSDGLPCAATEMCDEDRDACSACESETCNGADDDCNGVVDDGLGNLTCGMGACERTVQACVAAVPQTCTPGAPATEICGNGIDDDCNGVADEGGVYDDFLGSALAAVWDPAGVGIAPTYLLSSSRLRITDAAFPVTPSRIGYAWVYDLDEDRGNQMTRAAAVGTGDFVLAFDVTWQSADVELTFGGVGLTSAGDQIEIFAGFVDATGGGLGSPRVIVRSAGTDTEWNGPIASAGTAVFDITRAAGSITVAVGGSTVLTAAVPASISKLAIVTARHQTPTDDWPFGAVEIDRIQMCW